MTTHPASHLTFVYVVLLHSNRTYYTHAEFSLEVNRKLWAVLIVVFVPLMCVIHVFYSHMLTLSLLRTIELPLLRYLFCKNTMRAVNELCHY